MVAADRWPVCGNEAGQPLHVSKANANLYHNTGRLIANELPTRASVRRVAYTGAGPSLLPEQKRQADVDTSTRPWAAEVAQGHTCSSICRVPPAAEFLPDMPVQP